MKNPIFSDHGKERDTTGPDGRASRLRLPRSRNRTLVIDIDGVLAVERYDKPLADRPVVSGAPESMRRLRELGYRIVLCTSRFRSQEKETVEWLEKNGIPFDGILFGKPRGLLYLDDRGYRFGGWEQFFDEVEL